MDGEGENSPYASALVEAIEQPGLRIEDVFKQTRRRVLEETGNFQVPWESSSLLGDFYFRPPAAGTSQSGATSGSEPSSGDASPAPMARTAFRDCPECPEMMPIPPGELAMGSGADEAGHDANEAPVRSVSVPAFAIGRHEVTVAQFRAFVEDSGYRPAKGCWHFKLLWVFDKKLSWLDNGFEQLDSTPVTCIRHDDARAYVDWLAARTGKAYRLPSEAEWEYAARAGTETARPWGDSAGLACRYANVFDQQGKAELGYVWQPHSCSDGFGALAPVGSFEANAFGLFDMIGNAWEWVEDCAGSYLDAPVDGSASVVAGCKKRVLRGGDFNEGPERLRSAVRHFDQPADNATDYGFRVALSADR